MTTMQGKRDFPYYAGVPVPISGAGWLIILAAVVAAFGLLITLPFGQPPLNFIPAIVYTGVPLVALAAVSRGQHTALFGGFGIRELGLSLGLGLSTVVISVLVGLMLTRITTLTPNASAGILIGAVSPLDIVLFLARTFIQLIGEELMTILPLLAVLWFCVAKLKLSRAAGLVLGMIVSTAWFAAVHLPTYNWNFIQCFGGIGAARLVLTGAYLLTRNLWVSAGAHIVNDWTEFLAPLVIAGLAGHTPLDPAA